MLQENAQKTYQHWIVQKDADEVLWLYLDKKNASINTLDPAVLGEFEEILTVLEKMTSIRGVIIASGKQNGFIAGADIAQFTRFKDMAEAKTVLQKVHTLFNRLEQLKIPTVAMIEGFCLGGGLELALACRYRVAEEGSTLGLPEIKLGICPGGGGSIRLLRLLGFFGLTLILAARILYAKEAERRGLVNAAVPKRHLLRAAKFYALQRGSAQPMPFRKRLENVPLIRYLAGAWIRKKLRAKMNPLHYPAPFAVLENWERLGVMDDASFTQEVDTCAKLFFTDTCRNLIRVFFLQNQLKNLPQKTNFRAKRVHVVGAGTMGGDIAMWCALRGMTVTLQDVDPKYIGPVFQRAAKLFKDKLKEPRLVQHALDRLIPDIEGHGISSADVIIEAVVEDLTVKQDIFKMLESKASPEALLATNTSSIPLDEINTVLKRPERLLGIHFFNPVAKMQLVEVVSGRQSDPDHYQNALSFVRQIDRLPLPVKSSPGFLINRILFPYLLESMRLMEEGVSPPVIDRAMTEFGMPMGPVALVDQVGLDVALSVAQYFYQYFGTPIPEILQKLVARGKLGKKSGEGFYRYHTNGQIQSKRLTQSAPLSNIADRLVLCLLQEASRCLQEGIVADRDLLDAGMIFGAGFAPFRGGPLHYQETL